MTFLFEIMDLGYEEWRPVLGFEGFYEVSDHGQVRGVDRVTPHGHRWRGRVLRQKPAPRGGHLQVQLCRNGRATSRYVHQLVLESFVGPCPDGMEACHNDGCASYNHVSNLRWDTRLANNSDSAKHGTMARGSKVGTSKLSDGDLETVFALSREGRSQRSIADQVGVSQQQISRILSGQRWGHLWASK